MDVIPVSNVSCEPVINGCRCRFCGTGLRPFVNLGVSPLCESFLAAGELSAGEMFYPLDVMICPHCWLAQLAEYVSPTQIFSHYAYFSSYSDAWLEHASNFVDMVVTRFQLNRASFVLEIASNDGYLLHNVVDRNIPCLGIEPAANIAKVAEAAGVPTRVAFFGRDLAAELAAQEKLADLIVANNVLAHVPDIHDFVAGLRMVLKATGVITLEFAHLLRLMEHNQFDTIYHEHFSYLSLGSVDRILGAHGLRVFDVEELWTHGGSLRVFACPIESSWPESVMVQRVRATEEEAGLRELATYRAFGARVVDTKFKLLELLIALKRQGARIVGYGAPGKGNTLLNYCGIRSDILEFTTDRNPYKHGKYLPGTRIPVLEPAAIDDFRPDYVLILPWNLKDEIMSQMAHIRDWGGQFIVPIPHPLVLS
jgi:SAM-dependent methyltransferase